MPNLVELPLLGVLREQPLHGYELKRRVESLIGYFGTLSFGSVYPMLRALEWRGHVSHTPKDLSGRIIYWITPKGEERFVRLMHEPTVALMQKLLFFQTVSSVERKEILQSHKEEWVSRLANYRLEQKRVDMRTADRYRAALLDREVERLEKDVAWLHKLINEEAANTKLIQDRQRSPRGPLKRSRQRRQSQADARGR